VIKDKNLNKFLPWQTWSSEFGIELKEFVDVFGRFWKEEKNSIGSVKCSLKMCEDNFEKI
jgi:hypothetical protein